MRPVALFAPAVALALASCTGKATENKRAAKAAAPPVEAKTDAPTDAKVEARPPADPESAPAKDLGKRDPAWFHPSMFKDAKVVSSGRSELDQDGLFSSQILFEMPEGSTTDDCVEQAKKRIEPHLALRPMAGDPSKPGRVSLTGETDDYKATIVCGDAKGTVRAYVGYHWLRL